MYIMTIMVRGIDKRFIKPFQLKSALVPHFRHEEHVDFPEFKSGKPIDFDELRAEHEAAGVLWNPGALTNQYTAPADGCATYVYVFKTMESLGRRPA